MSTPPRNGKRTRPFVHEEVNKNNSLQQQQQTSSIPPEYQSDPDLWYAIQASLGNETQALDNGANQDYGVGAAMDDWTNIDEQAFEQHSTRANGMEIAHNVSMDGGTPKKRQELGPIFDETEFGPSGTAPRV